MKTPEKPFEHLSAQAQSSDPKQLLQAEFTLVKAFTALWLFHEIEELKNQPQTTCIEAAHTLFRAFCDLILNPHYTISDQAQYHFCIAKSGYTLIFHFSLRKDPLLLHVAISEMDLPDAQKLQRHCLAMTTLSAAALGREIVDAMLDQAPFDLAYCTLMGLCATRGDLTEAESTARSWCYQRRLTLPNTFNPRFHVYRDTLSPAMLCAYHTNHPEAAAFKRHLNEIVQHALDQTHPPPPYKPDKTRPRMVIIGEKLHSTHVVFRCYQAIIAGCFEHFDVHAMVNPRAAQDPDILAFFHQQVTALDEDPKANIEAIKSLAPDILYFPSVGMNWESITLANCRLAPVQLCTLGHPDTSASAHMDYLLIDNCLLASDPDHYQDTYTEKIVPISPDPNIPYTFSRLAHSELIEPIITPAPKQVSIAIVGNIIKINHTLIDCCETLQARTDKTLIFQFFSGISGLEEVIMAHRLEQRLSHIIVHRRAAVVQYLAALANCHLALGTFPFGGTNSLIDAMEVGTPVVSLISNDTMGRTDLHIHRRLGTEKQLCAEDQETYLVLAQQLIEDDHYRMQLAKQAQAQCQQLYPKPGADATNPRWGDAMKWLYENHGILSANSDRIVHIPEAAYAN